MKKKAFLLIIMCLAVALCMVMASCEKKDDNKNNPAAPATSASVAEGTNKDSDATGAMGEEGTSKPTSFPSIDPSSEVTFDISDNTQNPSSNSTNIPTTVPTTVPTTSGNSQGNTANPTEASGNATATQKPATPAPTKSHIDLPVDWWK